jgi:predicted kinase
MNKVIITVGNVASGKSTWARAIVNKKDSDTIRVNKDDLRAMLNDGVWTGENEKFVIAARNALVLEALANFKDVIVDDTNLHPKHIEEITKLVEGLATVEINDSFLKVPLQECIERDLMRPEKQGRVGKKVIMDMYRKYIVPSLNKQQVSFNPALPTCIISDLDGTLSLFGNKNPYDRDFENDEPNIPVVEAVKTLTEQRPLILFSGRSNKFEAQTRTWLKKQGIGYTMLVMREEGDFRKDTIVKNEFYTKYIENNYNVFAVFDDRLSVIGMWESKGLFVFNVNQGRIDF